MVIKDSSLMVVSLEMIGFCKSLWSLLKENITQLLSFFTFQITHYIHFIRKSDMRTTLLIVLLINGQKRFSLQAVLLLNPLQMETLIFKHVFKLYYQKTCFFNCEAMILVQSFPKTACNIPCVMFIITLLIHLFLS